MPLSQLANGETGLVIRNKINAAITAVDYETSANPLQRLKRAIAANNNNRFNQLPWMPPASHAVSTAYVTGQRVVSSGNIYLCDAGGTTGASSPPTVTTPSQITDGTVKWFYIGPTYSADPNAPSLSIGSSAPSLGRFYRNATGSFSSGAATVISNDAWFNYYGSLAAPDSNGFGNFTLGLSSTLEFMSDDTAICIVQNAASGPYGPTIEVDGRYLQDTKLAIGSSGQTYYSITFSSKKPRRITVRWPSNSVSTSIRGVYCSATGTIWSPPKKDGALRGYIFGDSFLAHTNNGETFDHGIGQTMAGYIGCDDIYLDAFGGTGFAAGGTSSYTSTSRLANMATYAPNWVIAMCSVNDLPSSQSSMNTAFDTWYSAVRAQIGPAGLITVIGEMTRASAETVAESYIRLRIASKNDPNMLFIPASGDAGGPWGTGTGYSGSTTGIGNGDWYWSSDSLHPNGRGTDYLGSRAGLGLRKIVSAL